MKTRDLTWDQAYNLLKSGMADLVEYQEECRNLFYIREGQLYSQYEEQSVVESGGAIWPECKFCVVEKPSWASRLLIE